MEQAPASPGTLPASTLPPSRQLPPGGNALDRISQHTKGLFEDITSWVELKIKLTQIEVEEKIEARVNDLLNKAIVAVLAALGGLFALITVALLLAAALIAIGLAAHWSYFVGFLLVTVGLLATAATLRAQQPELVHVGDKHARVDDDKLVHAADLQ